MSAQKITHTPIPQLIQEYSAALDWLKSSGLTSRHRFVVNQARLQDELKRSAKQLSSPSSMMVDLFQLPFIHRSFAQEEDSVFRNKLKLMCKDPVDPFMNADAPGRNAQAELVIAASIKEKLSAPISWEEPDFVTVTDLKRIGFAVKRPQKLSSIKRSISSASKQLLRGFETPTPEGLHAGVVALEATLLANPHHGYAAADRRAEPGELVTELISSPVYDHIRQLHNRKQFRFHPNTLCILIHGVVVSPVPSKGYFIQDRNVNIIWNPSASSTMRRLLPLGTSRSSVSRTDPDRS